MYSTYAGNQQELASMVGCRIGQQTLKLEWVCKNSSGPSVEQSE